MSDWKSLDFLEKTHIKGLWGEFQLNRTLNERLYAVPYSIRTQNGNCFLFNRLVIPSWFDKENQRQRTTEIDTLLVCQKGIFVFEVKSWFSENGVSGSVEDEFWYKHHKDNTEQVGNPFRQNTHHLKYLKKLIGSYRSMYNCVFLINASPFGSKPVSFLGQKHSQLLLSEQEAGSFVENKDFVLSGNEVRSIAQKLQVYA